MAEIKQSTPGSSTVKKPAPQSFGFDIEKFSENFAKSTVLREERQKQERAALESEQQTNEVLRGLQEESLEAKQEYLDGLMPLVDASKSISSASQRQMQLQSSGSFLDQLQAMEDAMLNPRMATSEGRARLRAELNAQASTLATVAEAKQNIVSTQMDLAKMNLALETVGLQNATLLENQHTQVMQAEAARMLAIRTGLESNAHATQMLIDQMTPEQLTQARNEAVKEGGKVNISGFDINQSVFDSEIAKRLSTQYDIQTKQLAIESRNEALVDKANDRILAALSTDQLGALLSGKPVSLQFSNGETQEMTLQDFKLANVNAHYDSKQKAFNDKMAADHNAILFGDTRVDIEERVNQMDHLIKRSQPGTPAHVYATKRKTELERAYKAIEAGEKLVDPKNPQTKVIFDAAQAKLGASLKKRDAEDAKVLENAAKVMGRGDKDLTPAAREYLTGQPISQQSVVDYVTRKAANEEDVTQMLGPEASRLFKKNYTDLLNTYRSKTNDVNSMFLQGDSIKEKEYKQQVAYDALMQTVNQLSAQHSDRFIASQAALNVTSNMDLASNPIANARDSLGRKLWSPEAFVGFVKNADLQGIKRLRETAEYSGLNDGDIEKLSQGQDVKVGDRAYTAQAFQDSALRYQNMALLEGLDGVKPGLAQEYVNWWSNTGSIYARDYVNAELSTPNANSLSDAAMSSMAASTVETSMNNYGASLNQVYSDYKGERQRMRQDWVSFDLKPENRQAALLQFDPNLSDSEKLTIYRGAIAPLLKSAKEKGLNYEETNLLIENSFENPEGNIPGFKENGALKKAFNKMASNRQSVVTLLQGFTDSPWLQGNNQQLADSIWSRLGATEWKQEERSGGFGDLGGGALTLSKERRKIDLGYTGTYDAWLKDETKTRPYDWYRGLIMEEQNQGDSQNPQGM